MSYVDMMPVLGKFRTTNSHSMTLAQLIGQYDLPILSRKDVEEHVAKMKRLSRPTVGHEILHWFFQGLMVINLVLPFMWLRVGQIPSVLFSLLLSFVLFIFAFFAGGYMPFDTGWLYLPLVSWMTVFAFIIVAEMSNNDHLVETMGFWRFYTPDAFGRHAVPDNLKLRLSVAEEIPGTRVRILADFGDPFLAVTRGYGPKKEIEFIGAWNTCTSMDNI